MGRPKKQVKFKEPVRLREKTIKGGNRSLYLDIYNKGVRKYEYLKLYLVPETSLEAKERNKETMKIAEQVKAERIIALQSRGMSEWDSIKKSSMPLVVWMEKEYEHPARVLSPSTQNWRKQTRLMVANFLDTIHKPTLALGDVDKTICRGFISFLRTAENRTTGEGTISGTTAHQYMTELGTALNYAVREGYINKNPLRDIPAKEKIPRDDKEREFLTIEELKKLINTPWAREDVRVAFLFSCFTGLRLGDIKKFSAQHIYKSADGSMEYICMDMNKTKHDVIIPLSDEAKKWLPESKGKDVPYFTLPCDSTIGWNLDKWTEKAGIEKHITFHCARHTFATMMLTLQSDIYTTSKLLGHKHVQTTEIYAKVIDKKKVESMNLLDNMFNNRKESKEGKEADNEGNTENKEA